MYARRQPEPNKLKSSSKFEFVVSRDNIDYDSQDIDKVFESISKFNMFDLDNLYMSPPIEYKYYIDSEVKILFSFDGKDYYKKTSKSSKNCPSPSANSRIMARNIASNCKSQNF